MKIGIFGGTFDPPHLGHLDISKQAINELNLDKLIILPAGDPPHKQNTPISNKEHRLSMCRQLFNQDKMVVEDYEIQKVGKSYTYETLEHYSNENDQLYLIIGGDSLYHISSWKNPDRIFQLAKVFAIGRMEDKKDDYLERYKDRIIISGNNVAKVSSTEIRIKSQFNIGIDNLVSKEVEKYIKDNKLYNQYQNITTQLKKDLKESRYIHTMNVAICGSKLAEFVGVDKNQVLISAILHDCAKNFTDYSKWEDRLKKENIPLPQPVIHAFVGSYIAKERYGIDDEEVLNAIKYHTTAKPDMSKLEKVIFIADIIESGRTFEGVEYLRQEVLKDFEKGFVLCLNRVAEFIKGNEICPLTMDAVAYYSNIKEK